MTCWNIYGVMMHIVLTTDIMLGGQQKMGANGIDPVPPINYPGHLDSSMVFGPFNLSDATVAEASFWMWRNIEPIYDHIEAFWYQRME